MPDPRDPPHSTTLESALLACLLDGRQQELVPLARSHIHHALVWWARDHQVLWLAVEDLDNAGSDVNTLSVAECLKGMTWDTALDRLRTLRILHDSRHLDGMSKAQLRALYRRRDSDDAADMNDSALAAIGGFASLAEIAGKYVTASGFEANCERLVGYHRRRQVITACHAVIDKAHKEPSAADCLGYADDLLSQITPGGEDDSITEAGPVALDIINNDPEPLDVGSWGIERLNKLVPLARNSNPIVAARPGVGKTSMAMQIARATARDRGYAPGCVAFAGVEVNSRQMTSWLLAQSAGVSISQVMDGTWEPAARSRAKQAAEQWGSAIVLNESNVSTIDGLCAWAKNHKRKYGNGFHTLIVDHVHAMGGPDEEYVRISNISRRLMLLRKDLDICTILLAQLSRSNVSSGKVRRPGLADLRGSGSLEQDASSVVFLHQESTEECIRHSDIIVAKNRYGACSIVQASYDAGRGGTWSPPDIRSPDPYGINERYNQKPSENEDLFS